MTKITQNTHAYITQIVGILLFFALQSCSIQEEIRLNPDYSGTMSYNFDMGAMTQSVKELQKKMDSTNTENKEDEKIKIDETNPQIDNILAKIKKINGINNLKNESVGKEKIAFSFAFKDLKALNEAYGHIHSSKNMIQGLMKKEDGFQKGNPSDDLFSNKNMPDPKYFEYFKQKGRKFYVNFPENTTTKTEMKTDQKGSDKQAQQMMEGMFKAETKIILPKEIKSNTAKNTDVTTDGNTLTITQKMDNMNGKSGNVSLKLK